MQIGLIIAPKAAIILAHPFAQRRCDSGTSGHACLAMDDDRPDMVLILVHKLPDFIRLFGSHKRECSEVRTGRLGIIE